MALSSLDEFVPLALGWPILSSVDDDTVFVIPTSLSSVDDSEVSALPPSSLSAPLPVTVSIIPSKSVSPAALLTVAAVTPTPRPPLHRVMARAHTRLLHDTDETAIATIRRVSTGSTRAWDGDADETLQIGGGALNTLIRIGRTSSSVRLSDTFVVTASALEQEGSFGVAGDRLALTARSQSVDLNTALDAQFDAQFYSSVALSLLAAINEAIDKRASAVDGVWTNASGAQLDVGTLVAPSPTGVVLASAAADDDLAKLHGVSLESIADGADGRIGCAGRFSVKFGPGEGASDHAAREVYLSATPGFGTLTPPSGAAQVVLSIGVVADSSAYDDTLGGTMEVHLLRSAPKVLV